MAAEFLYLDHAATTALLPAARDAMARGFAIWANPSSPHRQGRAARAAVEGARRRFAELLGWEGEVIFTSGASEALALAITGSVMPLAAASSVEHDAVLRLAGTAARWAVDDCGHVASLPAATGLIAVQHVNNETGVIQPVSAIAAEVRAAGGLLLADCAQSAGKLDLPDADMIAVSAHKFGGPIGAGALLLRDYAMLRAGGGQERGYRAGTENLPAIMGMVAALEQGNAWLVEARRLRLRLEASLEAGGGEVIGRGANRIAGIGACRMPGVAAVTQLIRFDAMGIGVSAGSACSSGSLKQSHVLAAMGLGEVAAGEVIRISIGRETREADIDRFVDAWLEIARARSAAA